jgi:hypothetical protein
VSEITTNKPVPQEEPGQPKSFLHPQCEEMHRAKYCVCCMVTCGVCEHVHPAHKQHSGLAGLERR